MSALLLAGNPVAEKILSDLKSEIQELDPKLVIVQVGNDPASESYIKKKLQSCASVGMRHEHRHLDESIDIDTLMKTVEGLNADPDVTGFIVQLPLPKHLTQYEPQIIRLIDPKKDVDGFGAYNLGKLFLSKDFEHLPPATPAGVMSMLEFYKINVAGKHAVIVGRSNIVGKPLGIMLLNRDATVTIAHSKTSNLQELTLQADILVAAVGKAKMITADMVKPGAVVIDIGINRTEEGLKGDVDFEAVKEIASAITPVPGGVGPLTVANLIRNTVNAKKRQE